MKKKKIKRCLLLWRWSSNTFQKVLEEISFFSHLHWRTKAVDTTGEKESGAFMKNDNEHFQERYDNLQYSRYTFKNSQLIVPVREGLLVHVTDRTECQTVNRIQTHTVRLHDSEH